MLSSSSTFRQRVKIHLRIRIRGTFLIIEAIGQFSITQGLVLMQFLMFAVAREAKMQIMMKFRKPRIPRKADRGRSRISTAIGISGTCPRTSPSFKAASVSMTVRSVAADSFAFQVSFQSAI
jgi:hypothetical protein